MNNEPPLVLISKQLLIVYEVLPAEGGRVWTQERQKENCKKKEREIKQEKSQGLEKGKAQWM